MPELLRLRLLWRAAKEAGCPAWELLEQSQFWLEWALVELALAGVTRKV